MFAVEAQPRPGSDEISDFASAREDVLVKRFPLCYGFPMKRLQTGIACCFTHCFIKSTVPDFAPHSQSRTSVRLHIEVFTNYVNLEKYLPTMLSGQFSPQLSV